MRVSEWGNSLAVRLPKELVASWGLKAGDDIAFEQIKPGEFRVTKDTRREEALERMRKRAWKLPKDYKFNREEANAR